jgi:hypothetical protein
MDLHSDEDLPTQLAKTPTHPSSRLEPAARQGARKVMCELLPLAFAEVVVADVDQRQVRAVIRQGAHAGGVVELVRVQDRFLQ